MSKSIFEKTYILKAQAEKAMIKEFGEGSDHEVVAKADAIPARFVIVEKAKPMADDLPENPEELDFPIHPELAAAELQMPWIADAQAKADKLADAIQVNAAAPVDKPRLSTCEKPTKKVWHIADSMPKASRKEVIEECVRQGIAYGTSRTQYQAWFKASQEAMRGDIRKPYEKV